MWLQLQNNLELTYHTKLWKDIWCTESQTLYHLQTVIVVPCEAINKPKAYQREVYNIVEIYLVCWWMSARMEH